MGVRVRMTWWICGHTRRDKVRNEVIHGKVGVAPIEDKMGEAMLRWFEHVKRRAMNSRARWCKRILLSDAKRGRGIPKKN